MMSSLHETELGHDDIEWPPGTIHIERVLPQAGTEVILQPRPSDDINDPLNWPQWAKHWNFALTAFYSMMVFALLDATTATWGPMGTELHYSYAFLNDGFAAGGATLALGGCLLVPFALKRQPSTIHISPSIPRKTYRQRLSVTTVSPGSFATFARHIYQPFVILCTFPAVAYMSLVYGVMTAWSIIMTVTLSAWMLGPPWNFSSAQIGLMSLPPFVGMTLGSLICGPMSDWTILWLARRNSGIFEPEMRLWVMAPFMPFLPLGAFLFGYALDGGWSWLVVAIAYAVSNLGSAPISSIALTCITDFCTEVVGDAPGVGMANVYVTIGVIGIVVLLFVFVFIIKGKKFRSMTAKRYK
ncbi:hypothetical protein B0A50_00197 [Salinomyces thailandicus]|uniref:Uncharacterized protein n=1 Tax=Salinomyces thailandicus TaxID=706561 RepID=A0A4U0UFV7_9PEZI|nr:hypothetical protein B0A50_00197 [Salinomyces thailandica]